LSVNAVISYQLLVVRGIGKRQKPVFRGEGKGSYQVYGEKEAENECGK